MRFSLQVSPFFTFQCSSGIIVEKLGRVTTIGLNRPSKRNCFNLETASLMKKVLEDFENDSDSYVAVLHGIGGSFCSGFDLNELQNIENDTVLSQRLEYGLMVSICIFIIMFLRNNINLDIVGFTKLCK